MHLNHMWITATIRIFPYSTYVCVLRMSCSHGISETKANAHALEQAHPKNVAVCNQLFPSRALFLSFVELVDFCVNTPRERCCLLLLKNDECRKWQPVCSSFVWLTLSPYLICDKRLFAQFYCYLTVLMLSFCCSYTNDVCFILCVCRFHDFFPSNVMNLSWR